MNTKELLKYGWTASAGGLWVSPPGAPLRKPGPLGDVWGLHAALDRLLHDTRHTVVGQVSRRLPHNVASLTTSHTFSGTLVAHHSDCRFRQRCSIPESCRPAILGIRSCLRCTKVCLVLWTAAGGVSGIPSPPLRWDAVCQALPGRYRSEG